MWPTEEELREANRLVCKAWNNWFYEAMDAFYRRHLVLAELREMKRK